MSDPRNFDLSTFQVQGSAGMDAYFKRDASLVTPISKGMKRVASLQDLSGFTRLSNETLIHKSTQDLWAIRREPSGSLFVERMFDDHGGPLKASSTK
jgi:hypothetical protein